MSIRRIRRLIPRKSAARWLYGAMMRSAQRRQRINLSLSHSDIIQYCVPEKINKRDWFCSLCVGQENYCMYIILYAYIKKTYVCVCVCKWRPSRISCNIFLSLRARRATNFCFARELKRAIAFSSSLCALYYYYNISLSRPERIRMYMMCVQSAPWCVSLGPQTRSLTRPGSIIYARQFASCADSFFPRVR